MPKNSLKIYSAVFFFVFFMAITVMPVFAEPPGGTVTGGPKGIPLENPLGSNSIIEIINRILNFLMYISVPILAFFILWGGFQILTARGNPANVQKGGKTIGYAVAGFAVILIAKGIGLILLNFLSGT